MKINNSNINSKKVESIAIQQNANFSGRKQMASACICVPSIKSEFIPFQVINSIERHVFKLVYFTFSIIKYTLQACKTDFHDIHSTSEKKRAPFAIVTRCVAKFHNGECIRI